MRTRYVVVVLGLAVLTGCPAGRPEGDLPALHPVQGKVVRGGQPVAGGSIGFNAEPPVPDLVVTGEVKADGSFELQTVHARSSKIGPGAPAGTYTVTYTPALGDQTQRPGPGGVVVPATLARTYTVRAGSNDLTIELGRR